MHSRNGSQLLIDALIAWGVDTIFGMPGDGINGLMEAIREREGKVRFIQVRHEESAALMACAHAKWTQKLGCCLATTGPGGVHLLNGLYDAKFDKAPVIAITGLPYHDLIDTFTQQDVDLGKLFADVAAYSTRIMSAAHVENAVSLACRIAVTQRTVAHVSIPVDVQEEPLEEAEPSTWHITSRSLKPMAPVCPTRKAWEERSRSSTAANASRFSPGRVRSARVTN